MWPDTLKAEYDYNPAKAEQLLSDAGYPNGFTTDIVVNSSYPMDLLTIVQNYFAAINVKMTVQVLDNTSWINFVAGNHQQDALASKSDGGVLGKGVEPIISLYSDHTGDAGNYQIIADPKLDNFYDQAIAATTVDQVKAILAQRDEYFAQQHYAISLLQPMNFDLTQPWLKGYSGQLQGLFGSLGPSMLFFYPARFWIDPSLKH